jgi:hypothetical protein
MAATLQGEALVGRAAALARQWHEGQEHFFGNDSYFTMHLVPVAGIVHRLGYNALYIATAYLHDIKEDTTITDEQLAEEGIPQLVTDAINLMAKKKGQLHKDYLAGILTSPLATVGKFADSSFNYSWTVLNSPNISDKAFRAWGLEYAHNISVLSPHMPALSDESSR